MLVWQPVVAAQFFLHAAQRVALVSLLPEAELTEPKIGFIVAGNVGGSVRRHRVARQLRHASRQSLHILPKSSLVVVRANKRDQNAEVEIPELFNSLSKKVSA
ncbi:MAG: ribonuclease P protein component [Actinobacteria bacterium]|nr:ribonuclease P protein component [Actinomycetota bacterium]